MRGRECLSIHNGEQNLRIRSEAQAKGTCGFKVAARIPMVVNEELATLLNIEWNHIIAFLRGCEGIRQAEMIMGQNSRSLDT